MSKTSKIKLNPNEQSIIPDAVANSSLNVLRYSKQNKFNSNTNSHLIISYGGSTDETFSNKLYIFSKIHFTKFAVKDVS